MSVAILNPRALNPLVLIAMGVVLCCSSCAGPTATPATRPPAPVAPPPLVAPSQPPPAPTAGEQADPLVSTEPSTEDSEPELEVTDSGLGILELQVGHGNAAKKGDRIIVHYVGRLSDGTVFDSSVKRNRPFEFELGAGWVIAGWDEGLLGMRVGGTRRLIIPPTLAYGSKGSPPSIPPDAILEFELELLGIER